MPGPAPPYPRGPGPNPGPQMQQTQQYQVIIGSFISRRFLCFFQVGFLILLFI